MEMELAARIQALREGLGMTQAKFAEVLIVSQGTVSRWEKGKHAPSEHLLGKIAGLAGMNSAELRYGAGYAPAAAPDGNAGNDGNAVALQLPPHHLPLRSHVETFLLRRERGG